MSLDSLVLQAVVDECSGLSGSKIVAIDHYAPLDIGLTVRGPAGRRTLRISVQPGYARLWTTAPVQENQGSSALLNVLRDHLLAGTLDSVTAVPGERVAVIRCTGRTPLGTRAYRLVAELIDRHTTLILMTEPDLILLETLRRIRTGGRALVPGAAYEYPEPLKSLSLTEATPEGLDPIVRQETPDLARRALTRTFQGLGPVTAHEVLALAGLATPDQFEQSPVEERQKALWLSLSQAMDAIRDRRWTPTVGKDRSGSPVLLSALPVYSLPPEQLERFSTMSEAVGRFYTARLEEERLRLREDAARRLIDQEVSRLEKLMENLWEDALVTEREDEFRKYGELLTINLTRLQRNQDKALVRDLYTPDQPELLIPMNPELSPADNAERYFKQARKARDGRAVVEARLAKTEERLNRARSAQADMATATDTAAIDRAYQTCVQLGLIGEQPERRKEVSKKRPTTDLHPRRFVTSEGYLVLVGRNSRENEALTKSAAPGDLWLHARDMGGSHVILRREGRKDNPSKQTIAEAATVAAYFSKGRTSNTVPVDYTERRYVRKKKNGAPGQVNFTQEKTLFVAPALNLKEADEKDGAES